MELEILKPRSSAIKKSIGERLCPACRHHPASLQQDHHAGDCSASWGVTAIPILDSGRILLIRQFRYPIGKFILELPAGKLDSGQSPQETVARELEEEIGYKAGILEYETTFYTTPGISDEAIHFYIARDLSPCAQRLEEGEHITVESYWFRSAWRKSVDREIRDAKTFLGIFWYARK